MNAAIKNILSGLIDALAPISDAFQDPDEFLLLLEDLGWSLDPALALDALFDANGEYAAFAAIALDIRDGIVSAEAVVADIRGGTDVDVQRIIDLAEDFRDVFTKLRALKGPSKPQMPDLLALDDLWQSLIDDLPDLLICQHLETSHSGLNATLTALGLIERSEVTPTGTLRKTYTRYQIHWAYFGDLLSDPVTHLKEIYHWDGAAKSGVTADGFAFDRLMITLRELLQAISFPAGIGPVDGEIVSRHYEPLNLPAPRPLNQLTIPVAEGRDNGAFYRLAMIAAPLLKASDGSIEGLLLTHQTQGGVSRTINLAQGWALTLAGSADASFLLELGITPRGVDFATHAPQVPSLSVDLTGSAPADQGAWPLFGDPDQTGLSLQGISAGVGMGPAGSAAEFTFNMGLQGLALNVAAGEGDGLLNTILGNLKLGAEVDLAITYGTQSGFRVDGSGGLTILIPIDKSIGPLTLDAVELLLGPSDEGFAFEGLLSASFALGPLFAAVERIGLKLELAPAADGDGMIGPMDLGVKFVPPSGYALALDADPIMGGGYVSISETEYRGALALRFKNFGFSAFAILNTELPDGQEGFSFAGSIFGEFQVPLAFGFFLTGVGGFIGINRTIDTDAMREVLFAGRMDDLMFPADPIGSASQILDDMAAIMPPDAGQHIIGPVVRISWGQPQLIDITLGVMLEFGQDFRIVILGGLSMILPDKDKVLVSLKLQFMGEIDFTAGTISFDATLEGSKILTFAVDGDVAIRTGWGPNIKQVASFGGLHPDYPKPENLPDLARLSISFGGNNPKLTLSAYQAITYNSLQVGARADMYAKGPKVPLVGQVAAEGYVAFDALIYFNPFSFQVSLRGGLSILVDGKVKAGLYFSLELRGPNTWYINGEVWVKVCGVKVRFAVEHRWGERETIQTFVASAVDLLRDTIERSEGFQPVEGTSASPAVTFRRLEEEEAPIDPLGGLRFMQNTVPLQIALQKIGEADIDGPSTVDLKVYRDGAELAMVPSEAEFVRGHFFAISESQRLSDPVFEHHKAGFEFADSAMVSGPAVVEDSYEYEIIEIPLHDSDQPARVLKTKLDARTFQRATQAMVAGPLRGLAVQKAQLVADVPVTLARTSFVTQDRVTALQDTLGAGESLGAALAQTDLGSASLTAQRIETSDQLGTPVASYIAA